MELDLLQASLAVSGRSVPLADPYGHAAAATAGVELFELGARRTGRTSRLLEQVQDGDRIICLDRDRRLLEQQLRDMGKSRVSVGSCQPDSALLLKKFGTMPRGRTFVDYEWCRAYFVQAINQAGQKPLKGVLLHGPPGCGKTMFARAAASVIGKLHGKQAELIKINGPEIQSPYVGVTEQTIREIFAFARIYAKEKGHPLTIFVDEAGAILPSRDGRSAPWHASNVAAFLAEMDGLEASGAFVILATNRPEAIDAALLRDGRCDRKIKVERPSREAARQILGRGLATAPIAGGAEQLEAVTDAAIAAFYSSDRVIGNVRIGRGQAAVDHPMHLYRIVNGAMLVGLVERAKGIAFRRDLAAGVRSGIGPADVEAAVAEIHRENDGLDHSYALVEFMETIVEHHGETVH